jgi:flavin-dependent dehydrogenase
MSSLGPLPDGGSVAILGGGPAGCACALALKKHAKAMGRTVRITLIEAKEFSREQHYNQCVGVLSPPLPELLEGKLDLSFPDHLTRNLIQGYVLHTDREEVTLSGREEPSVALRRVQFDAYMLEQARTRGIQILPARATDLEFHDDGAILYTDSTPLQADVIVGAFGMDEGSAAMFSRATDYRSPEALISVVTKYHPGPGAMEAFGSRIHAFLPRDPIIEFGGITPKGNHLTVNIAGISVDSARMQLFLSRPEVQSALIGFEHAGDFDSRDLRFYKGRFPRSRARGYYGDRFVIVGDGAGLVRAFKGKGVTSAVETGIRAAATILRAGISATAFDQHYRAANKDLLRDLPYGQAMRLMTIAMARYGLLDAVLRASRNSPRLSHALFGAVSARDTYEQVLRTAVTPSNLLAIARASLLAPVVSH